MLAASPHRHLFHIFLMVLVFVVNMDRYKIANEQLPSNKWIADCANYKFPAAPDALYHCGPGYNFISPSADSTFCNPPEGTTAVYLKDLEFGLRFPLNEEVKNILKAMNVAICQLHPLCIRTIVSFVWTCKFLGFNPSVNVFSLATSTLF